MLTVTDNGLGMDKNSINRAFEPFFTTKGMAHRTGLGLASTYGIIKAHGGFIDIESEKGQGTTIKIYIPEIREEVKEETKQTGDILMGKGTVLFVDDEEIVLETGGQMIERIGYNVFTAQSGKKAIEIFEEKRQDIDLVLLDLIMPEISGSTTFDRIKEINPDVKVLLSSGYSLDGEAKRIMERGCDGFIQKPFNIKGLSQKLADILEQ
jgi:two-component system cell cycle sensor histidine kinase/response regulator CckA